MNVAKIKSVQSSGVKQGAGCNTAKKKKKERNGTQQPVTKDRKTAGLEESTRDHPVGMTGATERGEKRRER